MKYMSRYLGAAFRRRGLIVSSSIGKSFAITAPPGQKGPARKTAVYHSSRLLQSVAERSFLVVPSHPRLLTEEKNEAAGAVFVQDA